MDADSNVINQMWPIRNITKKLRRPHWPSINSPEYTDMAGARWSLSFFPYDRRINNEEYTSFRLNLYSLPQHLMVPSTISVEMALIYFTGVFMRRKTFYQTVQVHNVDDITQVIFRYSTKHLKRTLRRTPQDNFNLDTLTVCCLVYFGEIPESYYD